MRDSPEGSAEPANPLGRWSHTAQFRAEPGRRLVFIAGQTSHAADGRRVGGDVFQSQFRQVYQNLELALVSIGGEWSDVISLRTFLTRSEDVTVFRQMRDMKHEQLFPLGQDPPNTLLVVTALAEPGLLLEIEAVVAL